MPCTVRAAIREQYAGPGRLCWGRRNYSSPQVLPVCQVKTMAKHGLPHCANVGIDTSTWDLTNDGYKSRVAHKYMR